MADMYNQSYPPQRSSSQYQLSAANPMVYNSQLVSAATHQTHQTHSPNAPSDQNDDPDTPPKSAEPASPSESKPPQKTQSTFLTKLYALLEKPENHHMIRWDANGDHLIVERPEQLALHVLPSVYRQSRFASFSRQLNIYGFMRKVNLRNVDPAIDDPDASTWSHPTLNRHSPPEVVANFKRRVPPRLPKPRKRPEQEMGHSIPPPRSAIGMGQVPLTVPSSMSGLASPGNKGRARGFSAPGSYNQAGWGNTYPRSSLPPLTPLTVPSESPTAHGMYSHSAHPLHPITPTDETPHSNFSPTVYSGSGMVGNYPYSNTSAEQNWSSFSPVGSNSSAAHSSGSLSSLLNPSGNHQYQQRSSMNSYPATYSMHNNHSASSMSPDSRPNTGYSVSSMSSISYDTEGTSTGVAGVGNGEYTRPGSSHHRPSSPGIASRTASKMGYNPIASTSGSAMRVQRGRRHSQAPYPSPYEHMDDGSGVGGMGAAMSGPRPSSSPQPGDQHVGPGSVSRSRSMIQLPSVESSYSFSPAQGEFAYGNGAQHHAHQQQQQQQQQAQAHHHQQAHHDGMDSSGAWGRSVRPSTSASSLSSSSQANTPPMDTVSAGGYGAPGGSGTGAGGEDMNRYSVTPDYGLVPINENISSSGHHHTHTHHHQHHGNQHHGLGSNNHLSLPPPITHHGHHKMQLAV